MTFKYFETYIIENEDAKLSLDWFSYKGNLKRTYRTEDGAYFIIGFFKWKFTLHFKYNHREREMDEEEIKRKAEMDIFIKKWRKEDE